MARNLSALLIASSIFGLVFISLESWADNRDDGLVEVEPNYIVVTSGEAKNMVTYKDRRSSQGGYFSLGYAPFGFPNYETHYANNEFDKQYGNFKGGMADLNFGVKFNWSAMALGAELGLGSYSVKSKDSAEVPSQLSLTNLRLGGKLFVDGIMHEPWVVPYVGGGLYVMQFQEKSASNTFTGNTSPAFYYTLGLEFQINWAEPATSLRAYEEQGIENSFIFIEGKAFAASAYKEDENVNFQTDLSLMGGVALEF